MPGGRRGCFLIKAPPQLADDSRRLEIVYAPVYHQDPGAILGPFPSGVQPLHQANRGKQYLITIEHCSTQYGTLISVCPNGYVSLKSTF